MRGYKKLEVYEHEDGSKHDIRIHGETGKFLCFIDDERIEDMDLETLRKKVRDKLMETRTLKWKPVISINDSDYYHRSSDMPIEFERYFKAQKEDGKYIYRKFIARQPIDAKEYVQEEQCIEGTLGSPTYYSDSNIDIPYDPNKWLALVTIEKKLKELKKQLKEILLDETKRDQFLVSVNKPSFLALGYEK